MEYSRETTQCNMKFVSTEFLKIISHDQDWVWLKFSHTYVILRPKKLPVKQTFLYLRRVIPFSRPYSQCHQTDNTVAFSAPPLQNIQTLCMNKRLSDKQYKTLIVESKTKHSQHCAIAWEIVKCSR